MANHTFTVARARRARAEFLQVLNSAVPPYEMGQLNLFSTADEKYIKAEVDRMLYEPKLPCAGDIERRMIARLDKLAAEKDWEGAPRAYYMAQQFRLLLPEDPRHPGRYYMRKELKPHMDKEEWKWVTALKDAASAAKHWERKWFAEQRLKGFPVAVTNFKMECLFLLRNSEGVVNRLVRLKNIRGEVSRGPNFSGSEMLDSRSFSGAEKFSEWCLGRGNFVWDAGVTELRQLQFDVAMDSAYRVVNLVESLGWHPVKGESGVLESGIWFFGDCAFVAVDGKVERLVADEDGIIWFMEEGYFLSRKGRESNFLQGKPNMNPDVDVSQEEVRALFVETCAKMDDTLGGLEAWMALGALFSFAAAPEIFARTGQFPGLFIHGIKSSGKTKFTSWLMQIWGFPKTLHSGVSLSEKTSTAVGMLQEAENYSNLPQWFDEYRNHSIDPGKVAVIRAAFDRSPQAKWSPDGKQRDIRTAFVVSGESTTSDSATRSRYPHVQVSAFKRRVNHLQWFMTHSKEFYKMGRFLMERRPEFVDRVFHFLKVWSEQSELSGMDERDKLVHGVSYASWMAMMFLLESHDPESSTQFRKFMLGHSKEASSDVQSETSINVFWTDMLAAADAGAIPLDNFIVESTVLDHPPGASNVNDSGFYVQGRWLSYTLYINSVGVLQHLQIWMLKQRGSVTLGRKDMRDQLGKEAYWLGTPVKRFGSEGGQKRTWAISVDHHPMGYAACSDEEYNHYLLNTAEGDPRKGELFVLVEKIRQEQENRRRAAE